jgi:DNA invertase Pin-like site-specific DNA recombinase
MLTDHRGRTARAAEDARQHRKQTKEFAEYLRQLAAWAWFVTLSFRHAVSAERSVALIEQWLRQIELAASGGVIWALAVSRGATGGRVHAHLLVAGVEGLDRGHWRADATTRFGDCLLEAYDHGRGGTEYFTKNAFAHHSEYKLGGAGLEHLRSRPPDSQTEVHVERSTLQQKRVQLERAALYVRVGPLRTAQDRLLWERVQVRALQQKVGDAKVVAKKYIDRPHRKSRIARRRFNEMMSAVRNGDIDVIFVLSLHRLARSVEEALRILADLFDRGVALVSFEDRIDTYTAKNRGLRRDVTALAKVERSMRSERATQAAQRAKADGTKSGQAIGRPRIVVDVEHVVRLRQRGWSFGRIAKKLRLSLPTIKRRYQEHAHARVASHKPRKPILS